MRAMGQQTAPIPPERIHTFRPDGILNMGGLPWQVLHTPGHASMQTCFYQPEIKRLLSADMLLAITPVPIVESPADGSNNRVPSLPQFLDSLDLVEALDVEVVLPGHGRPILDHRMVISRQRKRIARRRDECLEWIKVGYHTMADLLDQMYAHRAPMFRVAGLWMLTGYLDLLETAELVEKRTIDGVWHYYPLEP
jgi:glyoxylase-like metal-dependent hydrolase (beta-lactamase superfamily II)